MLATFGKIDGFPALMLWDRDKETPRAVLLVDKAGKPQLSFLDEARKTRVSLIVGQNGPYLSFSDASETETLRMAQRDQVGSLIAFRDGEKVVASFGTGTNGEMPSLLLGNKFIAALDEHSLPKLELHDNDDRRVILSVDGTGPRLQLLYTNGKTAVALGVSKTDHLPVFGLVDDKGNVLFHEPQVR